jgi:hypothetical protein
MGNCPVRGIAGCQPTRISPRGIALPGFAYRRRFGALRCRMHVRSRAQMTTLPPMLRSPVRCRPMRPRGSNSASCWGRALRSAGQDCVARKHPRCRLDFRSCPIHGYPVQTCLDAARQYEPGFQRASRNVHAGAVLTSFGADVLDRYRRIAAAAETAGGERSRRPRKGRSTGR